MPVLQPGSVSNSSVNRQFVSDLSILKPQYFPQFIEKYGSQNYAQLLEALGMKATVPSKKFGHFESRGKLHDSVKIASGGVTGGASAGAAITIEVDATSVSGTKSPVRLGEIVENAKNGKQYKITTVTDYNTFSMTPLDHTETANTNVAALDFLIFRGISEAGEASTKFDSLSALVEEKTFYTTEIREDYSITDRAKIEELWFEVNGQPYYTYKGLDEAVRRFMNNKEFKLMFGKPLTNATASLNQGSTGLIPQVEAGGQVYSAWDSAQNFAIADFHALSRLADFNGGAQEYHFLMDAYMRSKVDDGLFATYTAGAIQWASVGGSSEVAVKYGFDSIKVDGITYHMKKYLPFNAEAVYGVAPSTEYYKNFGLLIPMKDGRDAQTGDKVPSLRIVYNEVEAGKEVKVWETGALAKVPTSDKMELNVHHMSYCGIQTFAVNQFLIAK
jgi:hypothetical protein